MTRSLRLLTIALVTLVVTSASGARRPDPATRAEGVLARMTRDEKVALAADGSAGIPRLGVPKLSMSDGPNGVRKGYPGVTAFPNAEVVAASWDPALAEAFGAAMGEEAHAKGFNVLLGPTVNILRMPQWGRTAETLGEDPWLSGEIGAAIVRGVQGAHVVAQVKHFAANNQETQRFGNIQPVRTPPVDVAVSERALREIYFPAFEAAVRQGGAGSVMCAYQKVNGTQACQSTALLGPLKADWDFTGFVEPDAVFAVRDTVAAIEAGVDNLQLGVFGVPALTAVGQVSDARLDDMCRRILTAMFASGLVDDPIPDTPVAEASTPAHQELAFDVAVAGTVLLKNANRALPFELGPRTIAVIGHDAGVDTQTGELGSAQVFGGPVVTPLSAMSTHMGELVTVTYAEGTLGVVPLAVLPADVLTPSEGAGPGLFGTYYATQDLSGPPVTTAVRSTIDTDAVLVPGAASVRWTGTLTPPATGAYRFSVRHSGVARLFVDGQLVAQGDTEGIDQLVAGAPGPTSHGMATLTAGVPVPVVLEYAVGSSILGSRLILGWQPPDQAMRDEAVAAASAADAAVVFVNDVTTEGADRPSLALPGDQDALIAAVAAANPRTIVVLHTAGPVLMPWLDQVAAVVQAWYPGQRTGDAITAVLFGDFDPGGRLPMTFPASEGQGPGSTAATYPGVDGVVHYDEGIDVGYRFYDRYGQEPLFPFGYGLSYTTFALDGLSVRRRRGNRVVASVRVANTGDRDGTQVVQAYVGFPDATGEPPNQLKGATKVHLGHGRRKRVKIVLDPSSFRTWSEAEGKWVTTRGRHVIRVGTSSRDLPLEASVTLR